MSRRTVHVSDLTGRVIDDPNQVAELRILAHPLIDHAVKLDAFLLEVQKLHGTSRDLVTMELVVPGNEPETLLLEVAEFDKLLKVGTAEDVLNGAERYYGDGKPASAQSSTSRRGRPKGSTSREPASVPSMSREQREAVRSWANGNGFTVGPRGRIAAPVVQAFEDAHKAS